jgi:hypothetical protein|tara:strand:- start:181 stop:789 length:609 start_codon:yes stop_codon:yes gene_type:complete
MVKKLVSLIFVLCCNYITAQIHCGSVSIIPNSSVNQIVVFDDFTKYNAGITINSVARLRIKVENKTIPDPLCSWNLKMYIENNSGAGTAINQWEEVTIYGNGSGRNPRIRFLEVRVRNICSTSPADNTFRRFQNTNDILDIISDMLPIISAGSCSQNVNGPGSYLTNYDEFNFDIDIRLRPGARFNPGIFNLNIRFRLEENI